MLNSHEESSACETCGSMVIKRRTIDGARYYIPIADDKLFKVLAQRPDVDLFILDRLQRAERIIMGLRAQVKKQDV